MSAASERMEAVPGLDVWLSKKGEGLGALTGEKKRFFTLERGVESGCLRVAYFGPGPGGQPGELKGSIPLFPTTTVEASGRQLLVVSPATSSFNFPRATLAGLWVLKKCCFAICR